MKVDRSERTMRVDFEGKFDKETEEELEHLISYGLSGIEKICFDMDKVEDISSVGLRILSFVQAIMNEWGMMYVEHAGERAAMLCKRHDILCSKSSS